jgi:hypothetical protein
VELAQSIDRFDTGASDLTNQGQRKTAALGDSISFRRYAPQDRKSEARMATRQTKFLARSLLTPAVGLLFIWMIVPLALTLYFSMLHYSLLDPGSEQFTGLENFRYFLTDPAFLDSLQNTLVLVGSVLALNHPARNSAGAVARSTRHRPQNRAADGDRAVLRDADGERAGLEEPVEASGLRTVRMDRHAVRADAD